MEILGTNQKLSVFRTNTKAFFATECWYRPAAEAVPQNMFNSLYRPIQLLIMQSDAVRMLVGAERWLIRSFVYS